MRKILLCLALAFIMLTFAGAVEYNNDGFYWDFCDIAQIGEWNTDGVKVSYDDGICVLKCTSADPKLISSYKFSAEDYPYFAYRYKALPATSRSESAAFFWKNETYNTYTDKANVGNLPVIFDGEWHSAVSDMRALADKDANGDTTWSGTINAMRFDFINSGDIVDSQMYLSCVGFFKTEKAARRFLESVEIDGFYWNFCDQEQSKQWSVGGAFTNYEAGIFVLNCTSIDSIMTHHLDENKFSAAEYPYIAYRYKAHSTVKRAAFFWTNDGSVETFRDSANVNDLPIVPDDKWHNAVANISALADKDSKTGLSTWSGTIRTIRFDPLNPSNDKSYIYLSRIGFFKTAEAAEAFLNSIEDEYRFDILTTFRGNMQCSYVSAGVMDASFDRNDYLVSDVSAEGNVVMYTDENGAQRVVPLSHVNEDGFISFSPNRAAEYVIGVSDVQYSDTNNHWAKDSIEYASQRKLFGGTAENIFSPDMPLTYGMLVTVMGRLDEMDGATQGQYYEPYLEHAIEKGYYNGTAEDFRPEKAVTRLEAAKILDKFISCGGYKLFESDEVDFSDVSDLNDSDKTAVNNMLMYGIMNGCGDDNFDPNGIMTRGEAAVMLTDFIKSVLRINIKSPYEAEYFRRDRIKLGTKGSFNQYDVLDKEYMRRVRDCGFDWIVATPTISLGEERNALLDFADKNGIEIYLSDNAQLDNSKTAEYNDHPSYTGTYIYDEPGVDEMPDLAVTANEYLQNTGRDPHINLLPLYATDAQLKYGANTNKTYSSDDHYQYYYEYAKKWAQVAEADFMSVDIYPLNVAGTYKDYVESINLFARAAREEDKEFYAYIQAYGWTKNKRHANLRDFRFQVYSMLSFGCKGLIYWAYTAQGDIDNYSLVDNEGNPTDVYYAAQTSLTELKKISDIYCSYNNIGAFNHNCTENTPYLKMSNPVTFPAISSIDSQSPLLIGCFEAKEGDGKAFTIVNMNELLDDKTAYVSFKIDGYTKVTAYLKGNPTVLTANNGTYSISLEPGEGVFVTLDK